MNLAKVNFFYFSYKKIIIKNIFFDRRMHGIAYRDYSQIKVDLPTPIVYVSTFNGH